MLHGMVDTVEDAPSFERGFDQPLSALIKKLSVSCIVHHRVDQDGARKSLRLDRCQAPERRGASRMAEAPNFLKAHSIYEPSQVGKRCGPVVHAVGRSATVAMAPLVVRKDVAYPRKFTRYGLVHAAKEARRMDDHDRFTGSSPVEIVEPYSVYGDVVLSRLNSAQF